MNVKELMTKDVASIRASEPLAAAAKIMWDCDCGAVRVVLPEPEAPMIATSSPGKIRTSTPARAMMVSSPIR